MEKYVLVEPINLEHTHKKSETMTWTDCMKKFDISTDELKRIIDNGDKITLSNVSYFIDEAIKY